MKTFYNPKLKEIARKLRNESTLAEILLWQHLRKKQMRGCDFHRQKPIDKYVVDFFCSRLKLIIEIDGESHSGKNVEDEIRQKRLESLGFHFLRFLDSDLKQNIAGVLAAIEDWIKRHEKQHTPVSPLDRGDFKEKIQT